MKESKIVRKLRLAGLLALTALVTGCPHNDYTLDLTPHGKGVERKLVFYRADGETNGMPKYESFPSNELAAITAAYPAGAVTREGETYTARGEFSGSLPGELDGAGSWKTATTSLGDAGFYLERFRGSDDLTAQVNRRNAAADRLTDLVAGWSWAEFRHEPGYKKLHRFLDTNFRRDLKNLALYSWAAELSTSNSPGEEFTARFGQYLVERGYLKLEDTAWLAQALAGTNDSWAPLLVQRFLSEKLEVPPSARMPESVAALGSPAALERSWTNFLSGTKEYRSRLRQWEHERKLKPDAHQPNPSDVAGDLLVAVVTTGSSGEDDHITVRLALPSQPSRTNGKWDEAQKRVVWDSSLEARESNARLPLFCYASWTEANGDFQREHFGRVLLEGDELLEYCLWRDGLADTRAAAWDKLLSGLRPGEELTNRLAAFQFTGGGSSDFAKNLLKTALERKH